MSADPDGGPAFPATERNDDGSHHHSHAGMSLRAWLTGQALPGVILACAADTLQPGETRESLFARKAAAIADAALVALAKAEGRTP